MSDNDDSDNDDNDGNDNVTRLPSPLDRILQPAPAEAPPFNAESKEYDAEWPNLRIRTQEVVVVFWNKHGNSWAVPYPSMHELKFTKGVITFIYQGDKFTLTGFNLQDLYIELAFKHLQHVMEYNPEFHVTTKEELIVKGKSCVEELTVEGSRENGADPLPTARIGGSLVR